MTEQTQFHTIRSFSNSYELILIKSRFIEEGIAFQLLDEYTVDVNPLYANAIGGIKLQVQKKDMQRAIEIVEEEGYPVQQTYAPSPILQKFDDKSKQIPFIGKMRWEWRFILITSFIVLVITGTYLVFFGKSKPELLTSQAWCVERISHNGKDYYTKTINPSIIQIHGVCQEQIKFTPFNFSKAARHGKVSLPGFDSPSISATWMYEDGLIKVYHVDTLGAIYDSDYKVKFSGNKMTLKSDKTTIYCYSNRYF